MRLIGRLLQVLRKQPATYKAKLPLSEDFLDRLKRKQAIYLGAVHTILREWVSQG